MQRVAAQRGHPHATVFADSSVPDQSAADGRWDPLLKTKLVAPVPHHRLLARPALRSRLTTALTGPLTLISAPAGFGKTAALYDWLQC